MISEQIAERERLATPVVHWLDNPEWKNMPMPIRDDLWLALHPDGNERQIRTDLSGENVVFVRHNHDDFSIVVEFDGRQVFRGCRSDARAFVRRAAACSSPGSRKALGLQDEST